MQEIQKNNISVADQVEIETQLPLDSELNTNIEHVRRDHGFVYSGTVERFRDQMLRIYIDQERNGKQYSFGIKVRFSGDEKCSVVDIENQPPVSNIPVRGLKIKN